MLQLGPFHYTKAWADTGLTVETLPEFWEAQANCLDVVANSEMVVITDITVDTADIHPVNKRDVGHRLARCALARDYQQADVVYRGPVLKSMSADEETATATLVFDHAAGGLKSTDGAELLAGFSVAGANGTFSTANAMLVGGDTVAVSSPMVAMPTAVRYMWTETSIGTLANGAGLPASPFRYALE
eukprot:SAG22_NODE_364_length_11652_cov_5.071497_2_plen_187_part_00